MVTKIRRFYNGFNKVDANRFSNRPGTEPGTIIVDENSPQTTTLLIDYNETNLIDIQLDSPEEAASYLDSESVSWIDIQGLGNAGMLQKMRAVFNLHPLLLEDVVNVAERPKIEDYENQLVIITRMVVPKKKSCGFYSEQVSLVLGQQYLLTVQEEPEHDCFDPVRSRIRNNKGIIRKQGADYLAYAILDAIIDNFFPVLELYSEKIEQLEEEVITNPTQRTLKEIYKIRRELQQLRRSIWPLRDAINSLIRDGSELIRPEVGRIYLRDCYDHTVQVMDMVENYRELASGLMDVYLSAVSNRMNEIMKFLTIVSAIFIPLTFIAGIYGMNFNTEKSPYNMPELNWYLGYPTCLALMATIAIALIYIFWRRGWFKNISVSSRKS